MKNGGIGLVAELLHAQTTMSTDKRALEWPGPSHNLTCVARRPEHRLGSQAGCESWRHRLAPKLPISQYHIPASSPEIAVQTGAAQVAPPESEESQRRPQRGPDLPKPNKTDHLDQDLDLHQNLTANMFQQLGLATYPRNDQHS